MIIALVNTKGGTGKSTLCHCLAFSQAFRRKFGTVALADLDAQGTLAAVFSDRRGRPHPEHVTFEHVTDEKPAARLKRLARDHGALILDVPGHAGFQARFAIGAADVVIIPCRPSVQDEAAIAAHVWPVLKAQDRAELAVIMVPSMINPRSKPETVRAYFRAFLPDKIEVSPEPFYFRPSVFQDYQANGATLAEYAEAVRNNRRAHAQAGGALGNVETIAEEIARR